MKGKPLAKTIAIVNQKGGVGKTTSAVNLAACLAHLGKKVILLDLDPQGNATSGLGVAKRESLSIYDCMVEGESLDQILKPSVMQNLLVAPSNSDLLSAEVYLSEEKEGDYRLKFVLQEYLFISESGKQQDYIIVDCPPSFGKLSLNALLASHSVLIPVQCEYYALEGLTEIVNTTTMLRQKHNPNLALEGILLTMSDSRLNLSRQVEEEIRQVYREYVFQSVIQRSVRLSEAPSHGLPIILYDSTSRGAQNYSNLAKEVIENETKSPRPWPFRSPV